MPPSPIPAPLPPWARVLLQVAPFISIGLQHVLEFIHELQPSTAAQPDAWDHIQAVFASPSDPDTANRMITTFDVVNITGGAVDSSWTDADYDAVDQRIAAICSFWCTYLATGWSFVETRHYLRQFTPVPAEPIVPPNRDEPFVKSGPPARIYPHNVAGAGGNPMPAQVALTSTDRTPYPLHWGRNYWPTPSSVTVSPTGHCGQLVVTALADNVEQQYSSLQAAEFFPVVVVTQIDKAPARALLGTTQVQVDDVFDIQRRRRAHTATLRVVRP